jgi:glycosyltransferase involved in cell wall biosynthesis
MEWVVQEGGECLDMSKEENLARFLKAFCEDSALRSKIGDLGRKRVIRKFSKEIVAAKTIEMYENVINKGIDEKIY